MSQQGFYMTEYIGFAAAIITTSSFFPQALKTWKTKDTTGISLIMYMFFTFGVSLWLVYGLYKTDYPLILANGISFLLSLVIFSVKLRNVIKHHEKV